MRMWNLPPYIMCRKHLLGEHVECHMFVGCLNLNINMKGYIEKGLLEVHNLKERHDILVEEMLRRGFNHNSPLPDFQMYITGQIDPKYNLIDLLLRCDECRENVKQIL